MAFLQCINAMNSPPFRARHWKSRASFGQTQATCVENRLLRIDVESISVVGSSGRSGPAAAG